jgi:outer membrane protein
MNRSLLLALSILLIPMTALNDARADEGNLTPAAGTWFTQNGPIVINFRRESEVRVDGAVAAVEANPKNDLTISNSIGYNFTPNISAQLVLGITADTAVETQTGARLGRIEYGAPSLLLDYRLTRYGALQPFAGVGAMYLFFFDEKDAALTNLKVDDAFGLILRAGAEVMLDSKFGFYVAANKVFIDTEATASLGASRVHADLDLDPWIFQFGTTYRF